MNIEVLENEILAHLALKLGPSIDTEILPENEKDYKIPSMERAKVSVCYNMVEYAKTKSIGMVMQEEDHQINLVIRGRKLRGANQVWDAHRRTALAIIGFEPTNCRKIYALKFLFQTREDGYFSYIFAIATGSELVEDFDETAGLPILNQITVNPADPGFMPGVTVTN